MSDSLNGNCVNGCALYLLSACLDLFHRVKVHFQLLLGTQRHKGCTKALNTRLNVCKSTDVRACVRACVRAF